MEAGYDDICVGVPFLQVSVGYCRMDPVTEVHRR